MKTTEYKNKEDCRSINSNQPAFRFPIVRSHLSPKQNRTCYVPEDEEDPFSSLLVKHTNGSPGEYKHFKSLLPLSAASIYSQQTGQLAGNTIFSKLSRAPRSSLSLSLRRERQKVSMVRIGREITLPRDRSITEWRWATVRCLNRLEPLGQDDRSWCELRQGESNGGVLGDVQDGEVYHAKSGTCAAARMCRTCRREGKREKDWDERTMSGAGQRTSPLERQGLLGPSVEGMSFECNYGVTSVGIISVVLCVIYRGSLLSRNL